MDKLIRLTMGKQSNEDFAVEPNVSVTREIMLVQQSLFLLGHTHVWRSNQS